MPSPSPGSHLRLHLLLLLPALLALAWAPPASVALRTFSPARIASLRREVHAMFQHAYQGYLDHAADYDELRPLSCDGINTWGSYSLTLIDALDTLAVLGNHTEFARVTRLLESRVSAAFDADLNVSVFETNIRIVGGLLGAHLMSHRAGVPLEPGWPCNGPLLRMAEDVAARLLPAFDTSTGMPYGTVNLRNGVPPGETSVTCTAGVGTFIVEFGALSRLTGKPVYEEVALQALHALQRHRSAIGLFGNHIDVQTGRWTAQDAGIGSGVDSFYEYLVKGAVMLGRPELLAMFAENKRAVDRYLRRDDWHVWVGMTKGQVTLPVFQSLEAYWPGVLSLFGDTNAAMRALHNYHAVWRQYGFLPEFYNIPAAEAGANRENYPLRPELVESVWYLWKATGDEWLLQVGEDVLRSLQHSARTACGYATIKNVRDHSTEDRMESFFLAETTKYLYLLFDPDNPLNNDGGHGTVIQTPRGQCLIAAGGYVFNTEAHPIDVGALRCCHDDHSNLLSGYFGDDEPRLRGEAFARQSAAMPAAAAGSHRPPEAVPESAAQLNANALPEPEPWQRKGGVTMATIDLASLRASLSERDRLVSEIMGVLNSGGERRTEAVAADADVGVGEAAVVAEAEEADDPADDSLIVSDDDELAGVENGTGSEADGEQFVQVDDDLIRSIPDEVEADAEAELMADAPVEVVKLTAPSRDADDNRSTSSSTPATSIADNSLETSSNASDDEFLVFDESHEGAGSQRGAEQLQHQQQQQQQHFDQETYLRDTQQQALAAGANGSGAVVGVISDFVQSVLRAKLPAAATFDADAMLERLRRQQREAEAAEEGEEEGGGGGLPQQDFRLLTCRAQPFLQRLSVMGEFF